MSTCESCGRHDETLIRVQRIYLLPPEPGDEPLRELATEEMHPSAGDIEWWCASCAATFPHVPLPVEDGRD
jgi:hypothetical protein